MEIRKGKDRSKGEKIDAIIVKWIYSKLPNMISMFFYEKIRRVMKNQYAEKEEELDQRTKKFLVEEGIFILRGICIILIILSVVVISRQIPISRLQLKRNTFGEGKKEINLILKTKDSSQKYSYILEEKELSSKEKEALSERFFRDLGEHMKGKNESLDKVRQKLVWDDSLSGYPFRITYESENQSYIKLDGTIGNLQDQFKNQDNIMTKIYVTAIYGSYKKEKEYSITLLPPNKQNEKSVFLSVKKKLAQLEKNTRKKDNVQIDTLQGEVSIKRESESDLGVNVLFFLIIVVIGIPTHQYFSLQERQKRCRKETVHDFADIVHLLTLYMGAGLSFPSCIHRIGGEYRETMQKKKRRYAFEEILLMEQRMEMGVGQKEACINWGKQFDEIMYQKLTLILVQSFSKGTKEARVLMENVEREAFNQSLDQAKREGEEAATKMLFPMIVLLMLVMLMVMFPAIISFKGI